LLECAVDISPRKQLIHTMPPNTDRPINRAMVVGCAVSATRNHLKLHEQRTLKVLFGNIHAKTPKLWKHSAMWLAASRTNAAHQFTNRPLMNSVCPPRCPLHSPGLTCMRACTLPRAGRRVHHRDRHQHTIPIALAALPGAHTSRDFVLWRFLDAGQLSLPSVSSLPASKNQNNNGLMHCSKTLFFSASL
jgi:hypothetical protein